MDAEPPEIVQARKHLSAIITTGIGASLISVPIWAIIGGLGFFGGFIGLLNLFRPQSKLKFSQFTKANVGIALGLVLKLIFPSLPSHKNM
jgi:hypothetical protein